jgi:hypothetical protein
VIGARGVGLTVNGAIAEIDLSHGGTPADPFPWFAVVEVPIGSVVLTATATDTGGIGTTTEPIIATAQPVRIRPYPSGGITPLTVYFDLSLDTDAPITRYEADLDGDGIFEINSPTQPDLVQTYTTPGVRTVSVRVTDNQGHVSTTATLILASDLAAVDQIIRASWSRFVNALAAGNVEAALGELAGDLVRQKYALRFNLIRPSLPRFAAGIQTIQPMSIRGNVAHYLLTRVEDARLKGYHVYFVRDSAGVWRIAQL